MRNKSHEGLSRDR